jgi:hypothetical protein
MVADEATGGLLAAGGLVSAMMPADEIAEDTAALFAGGIAGLAAGRGFAGLGIDWGVADSLTG